jgi:hypothetical protein
LSGDPLKPLVRQVRLAGFDAHRAPLQGDPLKPLVRQLRPHATFLSRPFSITRSQEVGVRASTNVTFVASLPHS